METKKTQILKNKPIYLGLSISVLSKTVIYEFWYGYKHSFIVYLKTDGIYKNVAGDIETISDTLNFEID